MNQPAQFNEERINSISLLALGFLMAYEDNTDESTVPLATLGELVSEVDVAREELIEALGRLHNAKAIDITDNGSILESRAVYLPGAQAYIVDRAHSQLNNPALPFNEFVQKAYFEGAFKLYGLTQPRTRQLVSAPFVVGTRQQPYPGAGWPQPVGHLSPMVPCWNQGFGQHAPGYGGFYPQEPIGSERETYSDEPSLSLDAPVIHRTTLVKGVEMLPDDVKLLAHKLSILVSALSNIPPINDKDFLITATFKGLEFTIPEALEILRTLQ